LEEILRIKK